MTRKRHRLLVYALFDVLQLPYPRPWQTAALGWVSSLCPLKMHPFPSQGQIPSFLWLTVLSEFLVHTFLLLLLLLPSLKISSKYPWYKVFQGIYFCLFCFMVWHIELWPLHIHRQLYYKTISLWLLWCTLDELHDRLVLSKKKSSSYFSELPKWNHLKHSGTCGAFQITDALVSLWNLLPV